MIDPVAPAFANTPIAPTRLRYSYAPAKGPGSPAISLITPLAGDDGCLRETARAVLGQSLQQWEWLIVGDSAAVARVLATLGEEHQADPRVRVVEIASRAGPIAARNVAVRAAQAPFIAC